MTVALAADQVVIPRNPKVEIGQSDVKETVQTISTRQVLALDGVWMVQRMRLLRN